MIIGRELFTDDQEEDEIISSILLNEYGAESLIFPQAKCILETIVPSLNSLHHSKDL